VAKELVLPNSLCVDESVQVEDAHRELAAEVLDILRNQMPGDLFSRASAEVKSRINQRRQDRRKRKALEQVTDPERAARIKINKNEKKTAAKKRKIQEFRHGKGSAGSSKRRAKEV
jgi:U3 small nucleolar RNA-associated protein 20